MLIEAFDKVYRQRMRRNKKKRVISIQDYFNNELRVSPRVHFNQNPLVCLDYIITYIRANPSQEELVLYEIISLLDDRQTMGEPHYISKFETNLSLNEMKQFLEEIFIQDNEYENFHFEKYEELQIDLTDKIISLKIKYKEYSGDPTVLESPRLLHTGEIKITYDFINNFVIGSKAGYQRVFSQLTEFIGLSIPEIVIKHSYIQKDIKIMRDISTSSFASLTLLVIYLIFKKLSEIGYEINSVNSLTFNNDTAPRVKSARLGGTDLFSDPDVVERIFNADKIAKFVINIVKMENGNVVLITDLQIDLIGMLKITFFEPVVSTARLLENASHQLYTALQEIINDPEATQIATEKINTILLRGTFQNRSMFNQFISELKNDLLVLIPDSSDKITDYFIHKHNI